MFLNSGCTGEEFFLTVYFEIIIDLQEVAKEYREDPYTCITHFFPVVSSYIIVVQYPNQAIEMGPIHVHIL